MPIGAVVFRAARCPTRVTEVRRHVRTVEPDRRRNGDGARADGRWRRRRAGAGSGGLTHMKLSPEEPGTVLRMIYRRVGTELTLTRITYRGAASTPAPAPRALVCKAFFGSSAEVLRGFQPVRAFRCTGQRFRCSPSGYRY